MCWESEIILLFTTAGSSSAPVDWWMLTVVVSSFSFDRPEDLVELEKEGGLENLARCLHGAVWVVSLGLLSAACRTFAANLLARVVLIRLPPL